MDDFSLDMPIGSWLREDMPWGDVTTEALFSSPRMAEGEFLVRQDGVLAGTAVAARVFTLLDGTLEVEFFHRDGDAVRAGQTIGRVRGDVRGILKGERLALNLLGRLSGIATRTRQFVRETEGTGARITDTRKTTPGLRQLEKEAVRSGGGVCHRMNLSDAVMIKDNHIAAAGGIRPAVEAARRAVSHTTMIEVEAETFSQAVEVMEAGADIVMLDHMEPREMASVVEVRPEGVRLEASGNITLDRVRQVAGSGVDLISVGELTHSVQVLDISLNLGHKKASGNGGTDY